MVPDRIPDRIRAVRLLLGMAGIVVITVIMLVGTVWPSVR